MTKGLDSSFLHYGVRKQDLAVIAELCKKYDLDEDMLRWPLRIVQDPKYVQFHPT
jgi:hypothetical protein